MLMGDLTREDLVSNGLIKEDNDGLRDSAGVTAPHIAAKYNNRKMLEAKWKPVLNCDLLPT